MIYNYQIKVKCNRCGEVVKLTGNPGNFAQIRNDMAHILQDKGWISWSTTEHFCSTKCMSEEYNENE